APLNTISPLEGSSMRTRHLASVVFPDPLSPTNPRHSPTSRSSDTSLTACTRTLGPARKCFTRFRTSRSRVTAPHRPEPRANGDTVPDAQLQLRSLSALLVPILLVALPTGARM